MTRLKLFWEWYVHLRYRRHKEKEHSFYILPWLKWYNPTSYSIYNCTRWAWWNSGRHSEIEKD